MYSDKGFQMGYIAFFDTHFEFGCICLLFSKPEQSVHYLLPRFFHVSIFLSIEILLVGEKYRNIAGNEKQDYIIGFHFKHYVILPLIDEYYLMNYQLMNTMIIYTYLITPPSLN